MITVKTKKLRIIRKNDIADAFIVEGYNALVEGYSKELTKELKDKKCDVHPNSTSTLFLNADRRDVIKVDKTGFCCKSFADSINITIKK